jgi:hypothetical protein
MKKLISWFLVLVFSQFAIFAQTQKGLPQGDAVSSEKFRLAFKFGINIFHNFVFTEESKITRTDLKTKKELNYTRKVQFFITMVQNSFPEKGFNDVRVSFDSLRYELTTSDGKQYKYNSQDDDTDFPYETHEFLTYSTLLGREFYMTYSPYNEVVKITGEMLDTLNYKINHPEDGIKDPDAKFVWERSLLPSFMKFIPDIPKNLLPEYAVTKDEIWKRFFEIWVNGAYYSDTAEVKLTEFSPKEYTIEGTFKKLTGKSLKNNIFGINELVDIRNLKGTGKMKLVVLPRGVIKEAILNCETEYEFEYDETPYRQKSITTYNWQLERMFR